MKTAVIGDIHGRTSWREVNLRAAKPYKRIIFLGDYFDTREGIPPDEQIDNFLTIMRFKATHPGVECLLGNHDFHYLPIAGEAYSGYQPGAVQDIRKVLIEYEAALKVCTQIEDIYLTHAGLTATWCKANGVNATSIVSDVNALWREKPEVFRFHAGDHSGYGEDVRQGPLWVRPGSLMADPMVPRQIVGHTTVKAVEQHEGIVLADTVAVRQFVVVEEGKVSVGRF